MVSEAKPSAFLRDDETGKIIKCPTCKKSFKFSGRIIKYKTNKGEKLKIPTYDCLNSCLSNVLSGINKVLSTRSK